MICVFCFFFFLIRRERLELGFREVGWGVLRARGVRGRFGVRGWGVGVQ